MKKTCIIAVVCFLSLSVLFTTPGWILRHPPDPRPSVDSVTVQLSVICERYSCPRDPESALWAHP